MKLHATDLAGLWEIESSPYRDERGEFRRVFCAQAFESIRPELRFVQVNQSDTRRAGTVRGMHLQRAPAAECKLVRCVRGRVFDVAVDVRPDSPTYLQWHGVELDEHGERELFIPEGFAHGFQALTDDARLVYMVTAPWTPQAECGVRFDDPAVGIDWPLPVIGVSPRDASHPFLAATASRPAIHTASASR